MNLKTKSREDSLYFDATADAIIREFSSKIVEITGQLDEVTEERSAALEENLFLRSQVTQLREEIESLQNEFSTNPNEQITASDINEWNNSLMLMQEQRDNAIDENERLKDEYEYFVRENNALVEGNQNLKQQLQQHQDILLQEQEERRRVNSNLSLLENKYENLERSYHSLDTEYRDNRSRLDNIQGDLSKNYDDKMILQQKYNELCAERDDLKGNIETSQNSLQDAKAKIVSTDEALDKLSAENEAYKKKNIAIAAEMDNIKNNYEETKMLLIERDSKLQNIESNKTSLESQFQKAKSSLTLLDERLLGYQEEMSKLKEKVSELEYEKDLDSRKLDDWNIKVRSLIDERNQGLATIKELSSAISSYKQSIAGAESCNHLLTDKISMLEEKNRNLEESLRALSNERDKLKEEINSLYEAKNNLDSQLASSRLDIESSKDRRYQLEQRLQECEEKLIQKDNVIEELTLTVNSINDQLQSGNTALAESELAIQDYQQKIAEKEQAVLDLCDQNEEKESEISNLHQLLESKDSLVVQITEALQVKEGDCEKLQCSIEESFAESGLLKCQLNELQTKMDKSLDEKSLIIASLEKNLSEKNDILADVMKTKEDSVKQLKHELKSSVEKGEELQVQLKEITIKLEALEAASVDKDSIIQRLQGSLKQKTAEINELSQEIEDKNLEIKAFQVQIDSLSEDSSSKIESIIKTKDEIVAERNKFKEEMNLKDTTISQLRQKIFDVEQDAESLRLNYENVNTLLTNVRKDINLKQNKFKTEADNYKHELSELSRELLDKNEYICELEEKSKEYKNDIEKQCTEVKRLNDVIDSNYQEKIILERKIEKLGEVEVEQKSRIDQLLREHERINQQESVVRSDLSSMKEKFNLLENELNDKILIVSEKDSIISTLHSSLASADNLNDENSKLVRDLKTLAEERLTELNARKQRINVCEDEINKLVLSKQELNCEIDSLKHDNDSNSGVLVELRLELDTSNQSLCALKEKFEQNLQKLNVLTVEVNEKQGVITKLENELLRMAETCKEREYKISSLSDQIALLTSDNSGKLSELEVLITERNNLNTEIERLTTQVKVQEESIEMLKSEITKNEISIHELSVAVDEKEINLRKADDKLFSLKDNYMMEKKVSTERMQSLFEQLNDMEEEVASLQQQLEKRNERIFALEDDLTLQLKELESVKLRYSSYQYEVTDTLSIKESLLVTTQQQLSDTKSELSSLRQKHSEIKKALENSNTAELKALEELQSAKELITSMKQELIDKRAEFESVLAERNNSIFNSIKEQELLTVELRSKNDLLAELDQKANIELPSVRDDFEKISSELVKISKVNKELDERDRHSTEHIESLKERLKDIEKELSAKTYEVITLGHEADEKIKTISQADDIITCLKVELKEKTSEVEDLKSKLRNERNILAKENEAGNLELLRAQDALEEKERLLNENVNLLKEKDDKIIYLNHQLEAAENDSNKIKEQIIETSEIIEEKKVLDNELKVINKKLTEYKDDIILKDEKIAVLEGHLSEQTQQLEIFQKVITIAEEKIDVIFSKLDNHKVKIANFVSKSSDNESVTEGNQFLSVAKTAADLDAAEDVLPAANASDSKITEEKTHSHADTYQAGKLESGVMRLEVLLFTTIDELLDTKEQFLQTRVRHDALQEDICNFEDKLKAQLDNNKLLVEKTNSLQEKLVKQEEYEIKLNEVTNEKEVVLSKFNKAKQLINSLKKELQHQKSEIEEYKDENIKFNHKIECLEDECASISDDKRNRMLEFENEKEHLNGIIREKDNLLEKSMTERDNINTTLEENRIANGNLEHSLRKMEEELEDMRVRLEHKDSEFDTVQSNYRHALQSLELSQADYDSSIKNLSADLQHKLAKVENQLSESVDEISTLCQKLDDTVRERDELQDRNCILHKEIEAECQEKELLAKENDTFQIKLLEYKDYEAKLAHTTSENEQLVIKLSKAKQMLNSLKKELQHKKSELEEFKDKNTSLQSRIDFLESDCARLIDTQNKQADEFQNEKACLDCLLKEKDDLLEKSILERDRITNDLAEKCTESARLTTTLQGLEEEQKTTTNQIKVKDSELEALRVDYKNVLSQFELSKSAHETSLENMSSSLQIQVAELQNQLHDSVSEISKLRQEADDVVASRKCLHEQILNLERGIEIERNEKELLAKENDLFQEKLLEYKDHTEKFDNLTKENEQLVNKLNKAKQVLSNLKKELIHQKSETEGYRKENIDLQSRVDVLESKYTQVIDTQAKQLEEFENEKGQIESVIKEKDELLESSLVERSSVAKSLEEKELENKSLTNMIHKLEEKQNSTVHEINAKVSELEVLRKDYDSVISRLELSKADFECSFNDMSSSFQNKVTELEAQLSASMDEVSGLQKQVNDTVRERNEQQDNVHNLQSELEVQHQQKELIAREIDALQEKLLQCKEYEAKIEGITNEKEQLAIKLRKAKQMFSSLKEELQLHKAKAEEFKNKNSNLQMKIDELENGRAHLTETQDKQIEMFQIEKGQFDSMMKEKDSLLEKTSTERDAIANDLVERNAENTNLKDIICEIKEEQANMTKLMQLKDAELQAVHTDYDSVVSEIQLLKAKHDSNLEEYRNEVENYKEEIIKLNEVVNGRDLVIEELKLELSAKVDDIQNLSMTYHMLGKDYDEIRSKYDSEMAALRKNHNNTLLELEECRTDLQRLQDQSSSYSDKLISYEQQVEKGLKDQESLAIEIEDKRAKLCQLNEIQEENNHLGNENKRLSSRLNTAKQKFIALSTDLKECKKEIQHLRSRNEGLAAQLSSTKETDASLTEARAVLESWYESRKSKSEYTNDIHNPAMQDCMLERELIQTTSDSNQLTKKDDECYDHISEAKAEITANEKSLLPKLQVLVESNNELLQELNSIRKDRDKYQKEMSDSKNSYQNLKKDVDESEKRFKLQYTELDNRYNECQDKMKKLENNYRSLSARYDSVVDELSIKDNKINNLEDQISNYRDLSETLKSEVDGKNSEISKIGVSNDKYYKENKTLTDELVQQRCDLEVLNASCERILEENSRLLSQLQDEQSKYSLLENSFETVQQENAFHIDEKSRILLERDEYMVKINDYLSENKLLQKEVDNLHNQFQELNENLRQNVMEREEMITQLHQKAAVESGLRREISSLKFLLEQENSNNVSHIDRYDVLQNDYQLVLEERDHLQQQVNTVMAHIESNQEIGKDQHRSNLASLNQSNEDLKKQLVDAEEICKQKIDECDRMQGIVDYQNERIEGLVAEIEALSLLKNYESAKSQQKLSSEPDNSIMINEAIITSKSVEGSLSPLDSGEPRNSVAKDIIDGQVKLLPDASLVNERLQYTEMQNDLLRKMDELQERLQMEQDRRINAEESLQKTKDELAVYVTPSFENREVFINMDEEDDNEMEIIDSPEASLCMLLFWFSFVDYDHAIKIFSPKQFLLLMSVQKVTKQMKYNSWPRLKRNIRRQLRHLPTNRIWVVIYFALLHVALISLFVTRSF
ncbi:hypothetical protein TrispH2_007989 [Trichoplax sp. H2]|nr:hypothetical protein TrispH2_007989 [Trichoplax sp. H2]|eukprot:RDD39700.1 hypothetical protein TrispH2_007989 [Trichoplax sp. H2]